ncbi:hypothetical protein MTO96_022603 [Rhipicephalus appendiculatus]
MAVPKDDIEDLLDDIEDVKIKARARRSALTRSPAERASASGVTLREILPAVRSSPPPRRIQIPDPRCSQPQAFPWASSHDSANRDSSRARISAVSGHEGALGGWCFVGLGSRARLVCVPAWCRSLIIDLMDLVLVVVLTPVALPPLPVWTKNHGSLCGSITLSSVSMGQKYIRLR